MSWTGANEPLLDRAATTSHGPITLGRFGGSTASGAIKNEDAAWALWDRVWTMGAVLDAHNGSDGAERVLQILDEAADSFRTVLNRDGELGVREVQRILKGALSSPAALERLGQCSGETSFLATISVGRILWWFSVGDCFGALIHPDTAHLGGALFAGRQYFQWVGRVNSFGISPAAFSSGVVRLRTGTSRITLYTDGCAAVAGSPLGESAGVIALLSDGTPHEAAARALALAAGGHGRDSASILVWDCENTAPAVVPSS